MEMIIKEANNELCYSNWGESDKLKLIVDERNGMAIQYYCTSCRTVTKFKEWC